MGVAVEGSTSAWPGGTGEPILPAFDPYNQPQRYVDVFNKGAMPFEFSAASSAAWLKVIASKGKVEKEQRLWVSVDWKKAPTGSTNASIKIERPGADSVNVKVALFNPAQPTRSSLTRCPPWQSSPLRLRASARLRIRPAWNIKPTFSRPERLRSPHLSPPLSTTFRDAVSSSPSPSPMSRRVWRHQQSLSKRWPSWTARKPSCRWCWTMCTRG